MLSGSIKSFEKRRWHFLNALGLSKAFTPLIVCETVIKDSENNLVIVASAGDGRELGRYKPKNQKDLVLYMTKFSSPWSGRKDLKRKADKLCNLSRLVARCGLPKEAIKPCVRLAAQYNKLSWTNFKRLVRCVTVKVTVLSNYKVRQPSLRESRLCSKPFRLKGVEISPQGEWKLPLWKWIPRNSELVQRKVGQGPP